MRKYSWTAAFRNDKGDTDGEADGTVRAASEAEARKAIAECIAAGGARRGHRWTATRIDLRP